MPATGSGESHSRPVEKEAPPRTAARDDENGRIEGMEAMKKITMEFTISIKAPRSEVRNRRRLPYATWQLRWGDIFCVN